jgi:hypothetical protein
MKRALVFVAPGLLRSARNDVERSAETSPRHCEELLRRPRPPKLEERRRKQSSLSERDAKTEENGISALRICFGLITERLVKPLNRNFLRGGVESSFVISRSAIAHREMTAITLDGEAPTQKTAAHFCGRVLGGAIDFDQNTTFHWTSQTRIEVFFHKSGKDREPVRVSFVRAVRTDLDS